MGEVLAASFLSPSLFFGLLCVQECVESAFLTMFHEYPQHVSPTVLAMVQAVQGCHGHRMEVHKSEDCSPSLSLPPPPPPFLSPSDAGTGPEADQQAILLKEAGVRGKWMVPL